MTDTTLALLAVLLSATALVVALGSRKSGRRRSAGDRLPTDVAGLRAEVAALGDAARLSLRQPELIRYDAFGDMGGRLSWSIALVDDAGTGVVLTSIHGRSDARSYAKSLVLWQCDQPLSPEEEAVVVNARARSRGELPDVAAAHEATQAERRKRRRRRDPDADAAVAAQVEQEAAAPASDDDEDVRTA